MPIQSPEFAQITPLAPGRSTWTIGYGKLAMTGQITVPDTQLPIRLDGNRSTCAYGKASRWSLRARTQSNALLLFEHDSSGAGHWTLEAVGQKAYTHRQLLLKELDVSLPSVRLGGFTQYGQLFDFRDWVALTSDDDCLLITALRPGMWKKPCLTRGSFADGKLRLESICSPGGTRRVLLFTWGKAADLLKQSDEKFPYLSPDAGHVAGVARQIASYGFARRERLENIRQISGNAQAATPLFVAESLPFSYDDRQEILATLRQYAADLSREGWLHPRGNAVAIRPLVPAMIRFHLADLAGCWTADERQTARQDIALLAELIGRGDFYPHRWAMQPPEVPYSSQSLYRGMLNQNFHTDCYSLVGVAGCVLADHPWARRWRQHGIRQYTAQLQSFLWPDDKGDYLQGAAWEESHTYAIHVIQTLTPLLLALRHFPEGRHLAEDPRFVGMCRFVVRVLSPPDANHGGHRVIPAIGDHHVDPHFVSPTFAWMAELIPQHRDEFLWAWQETGRHAESQEHALQRVIGQLLPHQEQALPQATPELPALAIYRGYGAIARHSTGTAQEAMLAVRCGQAWGHYHHDQGSFWWWAGGQLICCESDIGSGELKHKHEGHSVLGYPGRTPMQYLDRQPFEITGKQTAEGFDLQCDIPVTLWQVAGQREPLVANPQPHNRRLFQWNTSTNGLTLIDNPTQSPDGKVQWNLHVLAVNARITTPNEATFDLPNDLTLQVRWAMSGLPTLGQTGRTWWIKVEYPQQELTHTLELKRTIQ